MTGHPLDNAYFRLEWAKKRLAELEAIHDAYIDEELEFVGKSARVTMNADSTRPQVRYPNQPGNLIPASVPILIGEIAYNLRASLDYLVYRLAILDSGSEQKNTQFPIEDTSQAFSGQRKSRLKGINDAHAAIIEKLQPYNGGDWTNWLRSISNPDKHRHLVVSRRQGAVRVRYGVTPNPPAPTDRSGGCIVIFMEHTTFRPDA